VDKKIVKIILIATDTERKSLVFVDENLKVYSLKEAISAVQNGLFKNVYTVNRSSNIYLRSTPSAPVTDKLDRISISSYQLFYSLNDIGKILSIPAFKNYWQKYQEILLQEQQEIKDACIIIEGYPRIAKTTAQYKLATNKDIILTSAKKFDVDPYLLGAILIDEIARADSVENITDMLAVYFIGRNTSIGIGQVTTDVAKNLIIHGYYNPDPDKFSSKEKIKKTTRREIYEYLKHPQHNIFFAGAHMRSLVDEWKKFVDLNKRPEIIASLYSLQHKDPHSNPQPNNRGLQIVNEFYNLAKEWLK
jgi:hypothetical protein